MASNRTQLGTLGTYVETLNSVSALTQATDIIYPDGSLAYVVNQTGTSSGQVWMLDKHSTATVDGITVQSCKSGVGRWRLVFQGVGVASPLVATQQGTVATPTDTPVLRIILTDPGKAQFGAWTHGQNFSGTVDDVLFIGYNPIDESTGEPVMRLGFEQDYFVGGVHTMEHYVEFYSAGLTNQVRPWFVSFGRVLGLTQTVFNWQNASDASALGYAQFQNWNGTLVARFLDNGLEMFQPILGGGSGAPADIVTGSWAGAAQTELERVCPTATGPTSGSSKGVIRTLDYIQTTNAVLGQGFLSGPGGGQYSPPSGQGCSVTMHWTCRNESNGDQYGGVYRAEFQNTGSGAVLVAQGQITGSTIGSAGLSGAAGTLFASGGKIAVAASPPGAYSGTLQWKFSCEILEV